MNFPDGVIRSKVSFREGGGPSPSYEVAQVASVGAKTMIAEQAEHGSDARQAVTEQIDAPHQTPKLSALAAELLQESRLDPRDLSTHQLQRFVNVAEGIVPPEDLVLHRSATSRLKRVTDIAGSLVGIAVAALFAIPIALAIRIDSKGPIFFKHTRCGLMGAPFVMWKFRSMEHVAAPRPACADGDVDAGAGYHYKSADDARITRVGRVLRATSLDELPQFLNVFRGEMSLVGTRPPTPFEVSGYDCRSWTRLQVKTGITGEWQVGGRSEIKDFAHVVDLDIRYQQNWSMGHDLRLMMKTLPAVLRRDGAV